MKGVRANILGEMYLGETIGETFFRTVIQQNFLQKFDKTVQQGVILIQVNGSF